MSEGVRHVHRLYEEAIASFGKHTHRVLRDVVELPDLNVALFLILGLTRRRLLGIVLAPRGCLNHVTCRLRIPLVRLDVLYGTTDALGNPASILHRSSIWIDKHIERRNTLNKRPIFNNNNRRRNLIAIYLLRLIALLANLFFLNITVANLQPTMSQHKEVLNGTTKLGADTVVSPPIVDYSLCNNCLSSSIRMPCVNGNLRIVNSHRRSNDVHRRKRDVDKQPVVGRNVLEVSTSVKVDKPSPRVVVILVPSPPLGYRNLLLVTGEDVII